MRSYIHVVIGLLLSVTVYATDALNSDQYTRIAPADDSIAVQYSPSNDIPVYYVMLSNSFSANSGPAAQLDIYVSDGCVGPTVTAPNGSLTNNSQLKIPTFATTYVRSMSTMSRGITNIVMEALVDEAVSPKANTCKFKIYTSDSSTLLKYFVVAQIYKKINTRSDQVGQLLIADEILVTEYDDDVFILSVPSATSATKMIIRATLYRIP